RRLVRIELDRDRPFGGGQDHADGSLREGRTRREDERQDEGQGEDMAAGGRGAGRHGASLHAPAQAATALCSPTGVEPPPPRGRRRTHEPPALGVESGSPRMRLATMLFCTSWLPP